MRRKVLVEVEIPRTGIKGRQYFWVCSTDFYSSFQVFAYLSIYPILVSIFEMLVLNA